MPIGVHDYESLVGCLKDNYERAFPGETMRDPQDAIQRLAATVMTLMWKVADQPLTTAYFLRSRE